MRFSRLRSRCAVVAITVVAVAGLTGGGAGAAKNATGGTITILQASEVQTLDNAGTAGLPGAGNWVQMNSIYDALVMENAMTGELEMGLAESIKSTDGITWTMKLKPNLKFSDGTTLDAEAVKTNWTRMANPAQRAGVAAQAQRITVMEVVDPTTLKFTLKAADFLFPHVIAQTALSWIGSPAAITARGTGFASNPVGAGPYMLKEWVRSSSMTLVRNPNYYQPKKNPLDSVVVKIVADEGQRLATLQSGGADAMQAFDVNTYGKAETAGLKRISNASSGGRALIFNMGRAPFNDLKARQALAYAMDGKKMNQSIFSGFATVADTMFREDSPYYTASAKQPKSNRAKAQKLFDEIAAANNGQPLTFSILTIPLFQQHAEWFLTELASYKNVKATISNAEQSQLITGFLVPGNYDVTVNAYAFLDPSQLTEFFHSTAGARHYSHWKNAEVNALLEKMSAAKTQSEREGLIKKFQELTIRDVPHSFYVRNDNALIYNPKTFKLEGGTKSLFSVTTAARMEFVRRVAT